MNTATVDTTLNSLLIRLAVIGSGQLEATYAFRRGAYDYLFQAVDTKKYWVVDIKRPAIKGIVSYVALYDVGKEAPRPATTIQRHKSVRPAKAVDWFDDRRLDAIVGLTRRAAKVFGDGVTREVSLRHDPERTPVDYAVVTLTVPAPTSTALLDGEDQLIDYLVETHAAVEDDFVVVCRRRRI